MKKKKPKKSSAKKSPPKGASSAKESPTTSLSNKALSDSSDVKDDSSLYSKVASDAQIGLFAEEVSQQSREAPDLSDIPTGSTSSKIEIVVVSADPSSLNLADLDLVPQTVAGSDDSILRSADLSPDVKATSSPAVSQARLLVLASADANVSLSSQIAEKTVSNVVPDPATDTDKNTSLVKQAAQLKSQSNSGTEENSSNHLEKPLTAHIEATKTNPDPTETWCTHAKGYGKPCPTAPKSCATCKSFEHVTASCPQKPQQRAPVRKTRRGKSKEKLKWTPVDHPNADESKAQTPIILHSKLGTEKDKALGESSNTPSYLKSVFPTRQGCSAFTGSSHSDVEPDSSDSELEDGEFSKDKKIFSEVSWPSCQSKVIIYVIYASNDTAEREGLWAEISALVSLLDLDNKPWHLLGDFNQIRDLSEHSKPFSKLSSFNLDKKIRDFNGCLTDANLDDLNYRGTSFTWWNKRKSSPIAKKLDRCLVNDEWYSFFPSSLALFAGTIGYHPHTDQKLSHLMFADVVMVFFYGSSNSLHGISECLDDFASWSGLHMNTSKTEIFSAGLDQSESAAITSYGFPAV
ncbi:hypothetical protein Bca52824_060365 [Brassica carinata]|uniref:Uncharacterized protein n=1 Tax=Brassica carinata TaxID=52824 RepID=A0A8X7QZR3_BRACI|nr:hypothetical protein Bca52824_060365 [Brassica carinata]